MKYYLESIQKIFDNLKTSKQGLTSKEAESRLNKDGKNKLKEEKKKNIFQKILDSIMDPMILMLLITSIISAIIAYTQDDSYTDVIIILAVVVINTAMGLIQESKAEKAIDALKSMTKAKSKVKRDGKVCVIDSEDIVKGDILVLEAGDVVPADARVIETHSMKVDEAQLTGESVSVNKLINTLNLTENQIDIPLADRNNMIFMGSVVSYGRGEAVVCETGMKTELGKIAESLSQVKDEETPLQLKMKELSKVLTKIILVICVIVFAVNLIKASTINAEIVVNTGLAAIALAVAAIPEGLPAVVTIILSIGVTSMSKRKALIRKLTAVETLGAVQVICTDKTGTLTKNQMTVTKIYIPGGETEESKNLLAKGMALCSDSKIKRNEKKAKGEPTENALVEYANKLGFPKDELDKKYERVSELPFDSMRKMMTTIHKNPESQNSYIQFTKGATEILIERCNYYLSNGEVKELTQDVKDKIFAQNTEFASHALRVLSLAYKNIEQIPEKMESENVEDGLIYVGFVGMIDPVREEVFEAIEKCKKAGIRTIMITGDHKDTAVAIAKELDIIEDEAEAIVGSEIDGITDDELKEVIKKCSVFARVQPEHKTRIVKALQNLNYVTAMTGDGVNDAPSIKEADAGISMGITGTDVTKNASDVVLADDNFATIVNAVEEGRKIYDNIRKVIQFQLSTNMGEVLTIFLASLFNIEILSPAHLLWINMITDSTPGLALGMEKAEGDVMQRAPRKRDESVFSDGAGVDMIWQGALIAILVLISYFVGTKMANPILNSNVTFDVSKHLNGMTMAFLTMNFAELFEAICMRSQKKPIIKLKTFNYYLLGSAILTILLTILVVYVPFFVNLFGFASISFKEFITSILIALILIPLVEIGKVIRHHKHNDDTKEA